MSAASFPVEIVVRAHEPAVARPTRSIRRSKVTVRSATRSDARAIHALVDGHHAEGRLLSRSQDEIAAHAHRFSVAVYQGHVVGCADLAPLGRTVAEVRSLVVDRESRSFGIGKHLVNELVRRAAIDGFEKLCAFTHAPAFFVEMGFSIVPHVWLPEKIDMDCRGCSQFRRCGKYAVVRPLAPPHRACVPLSSLHG